VITSIPLITAYIRKKLSEAKEKDKEKEIK
jgi:hypothetical protein